jgi:hypothetical protein
VLLGEAVGTEEPPPPAAVEARVMAAIEQRRPAPRPPLFKRPISLVPSRQGAAWAAVTAVLLLAGVVAGSMLLPRDPLTSPPPQVRALDHYEAHLLGSQIRAPELAEADARAALWHLAHCRECYAAFVAHGKLTGRGPARPAPAAAVSVTTRPAAPQACNSPSCPLHGCATEPGNSPGANAPP